MTANELLKEAGVIKTQQDNPKVEIFKQVTKQMADTYEAKNSDYGDSFTESLNEWGPVAAATRIGDKFNRFKSLLKRKQMVKDESINDTLLDMATYCIMTYMWMQENRHN